VDVEDSAGALNMPAIWATVLVRASYSSWGHFSLVGAECGLRPPTWARGRGRQRGPSHRRGARQTSTPTKRPPLATLPHRRTGGAVRACAMPVLGDDELALVLGQDPGQHPEHWLCPRGAVSIPSMTCRPMPRVWRSGIKVDQVVAGTFPDEVELGPGRLRTESLLPPAV
jgi:hypothetical protein